MRSHPFRESFGAFPSARLTSGFPVRLIVAEGQKQTQDLQAAVLLTKNRVMRYFSIRNDYFVWRYDSVHPYNTFPQIVPFFPQMMLGK
jgi:hypothetical protein